MPSPYVNLPTPGNENEEYKMSLQKIGQQALQGWNEQEVAELDAAIQEQGQDPESTSAMEGILAMAPELNKAKQEANATGEDFNRMKIGGIIGAVFGGLGDIAAAGAPISRSRGGLRYGRGTQAGMEMFQKGIGGERQLKIDEQIMKAINEGTVDQLPASLQKIALQVQGQKQDLKVGELSLKKLEAEIAQLSPESAAKIRSALETGDTSALSTVELDKYYKYRGSENKDLMDALKAKSEFQDQRLALSKETREQAKEERAVTKEKREERKELVERNAAQEQLRTGDLKAASAEAALNRIEKSGLITRVLATPGILSAPRETITRTLAFVGSDSAEQAASDLVTIRQFLGQEALNILRNFTGAKSNFELQYAEQIGGTTSWTPSSIKKAFQDFKNELQQRKSEFRDLYGEEGKGDAPSVAPKTSSSIPAPSTGNTVNWGDL